MRARFAIAISAVLGCSAPEHAATTPYPAGPYAIALGSTLPNLRFEGAREDGSRGPITLGDYVDPEGGTLMLVVNGGLWCGTCRWLAEHPVSDVQRLDLVVGDRDNAPATAEAAVRYRDAFALDTAVGADPDHRLQNILDDQRALLPLVVLVDTATMTAARWLSNPSTTELELAIAGDEGFARQPLVDDMFREHDWALLQQTHLPTAPPPDPTNRVAESPAAAELGRALFFDRGLSPSDAVACASCHRPDEQLADDLPRAMGVAEGNRRTPAIALAAHARWQLWDGRADSLWAQALDPLEDPREHGSSRTFVARRVLTTHRAGYEAVFGDAPDTSTWPADGRPGDAAFDALPTEQRNSITEVFVNVGKAIAAWERTLRVRRNRFDDYLDGDFDALDSEEKYGLTLFVHSGCMQCHWGPRLTDDAFHNIRNPTGRRDGRADEGRLAGIAAWQGSDMRSDGRWSDAPTTRPTREDERLLGQFKTPPLRGVADAAFLGHGGTFGSLSEMCESYGWGGVPAGDPESAGTRESWLVPFGETTQWGLVPFLEVLTAEPVSP